MRVIGCGGMARAGKDTFCNIAKNILEENGYKVKKYSFARVLKNEVAPFLRDTCGVDVWTDNTEIKTDIRDFLVWYGTTFWRKRDPKRWIRGVDNALKTDGNEIDIALVSDVRYPNEAEWVHSWGGYLVHVAAYKVNTTRYELGGDWVKEKVFLDAPNEQERINDPIVKGASDYKVEWEARGLTLEEASKHPEIQTEVLKALNSCDMFSEVLIRSGDDGAVKVEA